MNYLKIYNNLVNSRKYRELTREHGYDIHHIIPKSLGGTDSDSNLVKLTYKEHFISHYLLHKAFPWELTLLKAFCGLSYGRKLTSKHSNRLKKANSLRMKIDNPMFKEEFRNKMSNTRKMLFSTGQLKPREITEEERENISNRMKRDNPMTKEPWKNHTASPVRVHYTDGSIRDFSYMKEISILTGVPYDTLKYASRHNKGSPKWGILRLEKL